MYIIQCSQAFLNPSPVGQMQEQHVRGLSVRLRCALQFSTLAFELPLETRPLAVEFLLVWRRHLDDPLHLQVTRRPSICQRAPLPLSTVAWVV